MNLLLGVLANAGTVNDVNFEDMGNAEAVEFLRKVVQEPGPLTLTIAKCWDPSPHPMNPYNHQSQAMSHPPGGGDRHSFDKSWGTSNFCVPSEYKTEKQIQRTD